ncbi:HDOD domain-containing protein [Ideonella sp. B7]|uniref:serine/threonine protein kinase n=1 Tax=Ideonella benzenivorans TaxID=2831643 RepID=UPI001CED8C1C|nr:serine/threonine protein kinase [Ideonella benzenivorans]MCA6218067.1 HDOD domain-containing protein [Ideonella benzenivorans]
MNPAVRPAKHVGRFLLRRLIGQGAEATVWLAHDPRLDREVALKLRHEPLAKGEMDAWLHEARAVGRLRHPHIVPVFEADVHEGRPYMVFEWVPGGTLAERLRRGPVPWREALTMACDVLDALQVAHEAGVIHRDLKPSNILIDAQGRARVMDFGIAARLDARGQAVGGAQGGAIVGTPGYIAPEAARGEPPGPAVDVFALALILAEMLGGAPVRHPASDPAQAMRRAAVELVVLPESLGERADAHLRAVLAQALVFDPVQRTASARALREALANWRDSAEGGEAHSAPMPLEGPSTVTGAGQGTLDFLWRRMRHKSDFPALGEAVARIHRVASDEQANLSSLANEILKDVALTHKLLRVVNSASFVHAGGGTIGTVSRAVALVGLSGVRNMALSLVLLEHMADRSHAQALTQEFLRALMAGMLAQSLGQTPQEREEAFIGAMFRNLGRLLVGFYFAEEAREVRELAERVGETRAAWRVLGVDYETLGCEVVRRWGLPASLQQVMRAPAGGPPARRLSAPPERLRWLASAANELADVLLAGDPAQAGARVEAVAARHAPSLALRPESVADAVRQAREQVGDFVQASALSLPGDSPVRQWLNAPTVTALADEAPLDLALEATALPPDALPDPGEPTLRLPQAAQDGALVQSLLTAGIADVTQAMVNDQVDLSQVLRMVLETLYRAVGFSRVVFCLRDAKSDQLTGRFGLGEDVEALCQVFRVPLQVPAGKAPDLFTAVCQRGADTLIVDTRTGAIAEALPDWFHRTVKARSFLVLPLTVKQVPFGMIYADLLPPHTLALGEQVLAQLRTLRNQAVMAFRQLAS